MEWLASEICKKLELYHCEYTVDIVNNKLVSKCNDFIDENKESVTAYDVFTSEKSLIT